MCSYQHRAMIWHDHEVFNTNWICSALRRLIFAAPIAHRPVPSTPTFRTHRPCRIGFAVRSPFSLQRLAMFTITRSQAPALLTRGSCHRPARVCYAYSRRWCISICRLGCVGRTLNRLDIGVERIDSRSCHDRRGIRRESRRHGGVLRAGWLWKVTAQSNPITKDGNDGDSSSSHRN